MMKSRSFCIFYILVGSLNCFGLATIVNGPTNQTTCFGASSIFHCVINDSATINWLVNGQDLGVWRINVPGTVPLSPGPGAQSTLILPGTSLFSGASVVCTYNQIYSVPAFLTIQGPSSLPNFTSIPLNGTSTSISWIFEPVTSSARDYRVEIRNSSGLLVYNQTLSVTQLVYTIPDPCDRYDAAVTAIYGYPNLTCTQRGSVQLAGVYPSAPVILPKRLLECSVSAQGLFNVNISISPQQGVCSHNILWTSSRSQSISYPAQKPIVSNENQLIFNVSLPFNVLVNLTVIASNSYGSNASSVIYSTHEILDIVINATSLPGTWKAVCSFISCSQYIGCLVFLNDTYCTASKRYASSSSTITCPMPYKDSLPGPGVYSIKAYAVLSNGSYVDSLYTGLTELKNEETPTKSTRSQKADIPAVFGGVIGILFFIVIIIAAVILMKYIMKYRHSRMMLIQHPDIPMLDLVHPHLVSYNIEMGTEDIRDQMNGKTTLIYAASKGDLLCVEELLKNGADVNVTDEIRWTALMRASDEGHDKCVKLLLEKGATLNFQSTKGWTALTIASSKGHVECVKLLLDAEVDHMDGSGQTALMKASSGGHVECVKLLLEKGADVSHKDWSGQTALMKASSGGHVECVKLLLEKGVDVNHKDWSGQTALMEASSEGYVECVKLLLEKGADVNHKDRSGQTTLMEASSGGHVECVKLLLGKDADVNHRDRSEQTALMEASSEGHVECVKLLLEKGADVNHQDGNGQTALMMASSEGHVMCVDSLLDQGAYIDLHDRDGETALMMASSAGHVNCVMLLLDKGASADLSDKSGQTALMNASRGGHVVCVTVLLDKGASADLLDKSGQTALMKASSEGHVECVMLLLKKGADANHQDGRKRTALMKASLQGSVECVKLLLNNGAIADPSDKYGETALMMASSGGHVECVKLLLDNGASADLSDKKGQTALIVASREGHVECVMLLLEKGTSADLLDEYGETALITASSGGHVECVKLLLNKGASADLSDESTLQLQQPLSIGADEKHEEAHDVQEDSPSVQHEAGIEKKESSQIESSSTEGKQTTSVLDYEDTVWSLRRNTRQPLSLSTMGKNSRKKKQKKKQGKGGAATDVDESATENTMATTSSTDTATPQSRPLPQPTSPPPPPLPSGWQLINEEGQQPYFWNKEAGESTLVRPLEEGKEGGGYIMEKDKHLTSGTVAVASSGPGGEREHLFMKHTNWANQLETFLVRDHDLSGKSVIGIMSCNTLLVQPSITEPPVMLILLNTKLPDGCEDTALVKPLMDIWDNKITTSDLKIKIVFVKQMPKAPLSEEQKQKLVHLEQDPSTGPAIYFGLVHISLGTGRVQDLRCWLLEKGLISLHEAYITEPKPYPNILEKAMKNCRNAVQPHHYSKIIWDKERMCEFFNKFKNQMFSMRVMSVNTVVDYALSVEVPHQGSYYVRVKPIGLLSLTTREGMSLYDTRASENDLHMNRMDFNSIQMVARARKLVNDRLTFLKGYVSFEALGINSDNTSCNLQVMLWDSKGNNLLSWMLEEGIAGLVGGSNYWNPETGKRDEKVRCLCPYGRSVSDDKEKYQLFQYSPLEWMLVDSEREAIREKKGMWAVGKSLSPAISRVGNGKRHIFIDSSNLLILQKKLSGKFHWKNDMFMQMDEIVSSRQGTIDGDDGSFSPAQCKRFKNSYYDDDPACRTHFKRLGDLLGFKKGHDPSPHIFGSLPPDNDQVWYMCVEVFGPKCVHLTKHTKEGKSTREDQQLISVMLLTDYNKEDDLVLVAGDGGYCTSLMRLMDKAEGSVKKGPGKVYVVSWGNCSIQLKHLRNVVFINLDPYLKYLEHVSVKGRDGRGQSGQCQDTEGEEDDETLQHGDDNLIIEKEEF